MASRKQNTQLTLQEKEMIIASKAEGMSSTTIATRIGVHRTTINRFWRRYKETGDIGFLPRSGRPPCLLKRDIERMCVHIKLDRRITLKALRKLCDLEHISLRTIRRALKYYSDFNSRFLRKKPFISIKNIRRRVEWCKQHRDWELDDWQHVVWSDESTFTIRSGRRYRVWVQTGEPLHLQLTKGTVKHDRKINVWGCFSYVGVGAFHRIEGIMDKHQFLDILKYVAEPSCVNLFGGDDYMFQQDNDPKHMAKIVKRWIRLNMNTIDWWPSQSPDLNPIENLWSILDRNCMDRQCKNEDELFNLLQNEWQALPLELLQRLVMSMPRRIDAVLKARGGPTKY